MAIIIRATEEKKITISGTDIELTQVYGRIRFLGDFPGTTIEGEVATFANKATLARLANSEFGVPAINFVPFQTNTPFTPMPDISTSAKTLTLICSTLAKTRAFVKY